MITKILTGLWKAVLTIVLLALFALGWLLITAPLKFGIGAWWCIPAGLGVLTVIVVASTSMNLHVFDTDAKDENEAKNRRIQRILEEDTQLHQENLRILKERKKKIEKEIEELEYPDRLNPDTKDEKDGKEAFVSEYRYKSLVKDYVHLKMKYQKLMEERSKESGKEGGNGGDAA